MFPSTYTLLTTGMIEEVILKLKKLVIYPRHDRFFFKEGVVAVDIWSVIARLHYALHKHDHIRVHIQDNTKARYPWFPSGYYVINRKGDLQSGRGVILKSTTALVTALYMERTKDGVMPCLEIQEQTRVCTHNGSGYTKKK